ncbi:MAG: hypothetical protein ABIX28_07075 [Vicinamibacterales bacterium]
MRSLRFAVITAVSLAAVAPAIAWQRLNKQDSDRFEAKLTRIVAFGNQKQARAAAAVTTPVSDAEINAYFEYGAKAQVPHGIVEPRLNALGEGRVGGQATVDLDAVRKQKQRGWLDPMSYLTGSLPLTASGLLITKDGVGRFQLESAQVSGVSVPKSLLQELLGYYSRTAENPAGISIDDPFELPARIREIQVQRGQATIVQ